MLVEAGRACHPARLLAVGQQRTKVLMHRRVASSHAIQDVANGGHLRLFAELMPEQLFVFK